MPLEELTIDEDLYQEYPMKILDTSEKVTRNNREYPMKILDTSEKVTRNNRYKICKVQWSNHTEEEVTWEKEDQLKAEFSDIFSILSESWGRDSS
jgi:hypothetical protein